MKLSNKQLTLGMGKALVLELAETINGTSFIDCLEMFEQDEQTESIVMVGEIGGTAEEEAAEYIKHSKQPVVSYIAGVTAPKGKEWAMQVR